MGVLVRKKHLLVYELLKPCNTTMDYANGIEWMPATQQSVSFFFRKDVRRKTRFLQFLRSGHYGVILHVRNGWVNHLWMSLPNTLGPPHLPNDIKWKPVYWIFYGHTREEFRGQGYQKLALRLLAEKAFEQDARAKIYGDTRAENIASRKCFISVGFEPKGVINTHELRIPRVKSWVCGSWDVDANHPRLGGGISS